jgi:hypothetical protein
LAKPPLDTLAQFAALSVADRRAIERHLEAPERATLRAALMQQGPKPPTPTTALDLSAHSPAMAKRLLEVLASRKPAANVTPTARNLVRGLLAETPT